jgi:fructose-bisphosphate aldolase class II
MALVNLKSVIKETENGRLAIGGFNITNLEMLEGIVEAAKSLDLPIIINVHPEHIGHSSLELVAAMVKERALKSKIPIVLHIDYITDMSLLREAIFCGFTSIMFVAAAGLSFEDAILEVKNACELVHRNNLLIESEFPPEKESGLTDPEKAERFVRETGIDILSPHIVVSGNSKVELDLELFKKIKDRTGCYFSLHGSSKVSDSIIQEAVKAGINKISVYSQTSKAALGELKDLMSSKGIPDMAEASMVMKEAIKSATIKRLKVLSLEKGKISKEIPDFSSANPTDDMESLIKDVTKQVLKRMDAG